MLGQAYFYFLAGLALFGAIATVASRNPIRSAMGLLLTILAVAGLFLALHAEFLAAIQLIVYAGAITVLFIFVIMLLGPSAEAPRDKRGIVVRSLAAGGFGCAALATFFLVRNDLKAVLHDPGRDFGSIDMIGRALFVGEGDHVSWLVPFELSSALLMVAVIGAVGVAHGKQPAPTPTGAHNPGGTRKPTRAELAGAPEWADGGKTHFGGNP